MENLIFSGNYLATNICRGTIGYAALRNGGCVDCYVRVGVDGGVENRQDEQNE